MGGAGGPSNDGEGAGAPCFLPFFLCLLGAGAGATGVVGAATGFPLLVVSLGLAFISGGMVAGVLLASGKRSRRQSIAFGPFIAGAALVTLLWGNTIGHWYLGSLWPA